VLPRQNRLLTEKQIFNVFKTKSKNYLDNFTIFLKKNSSKNFRLLVLVSKKVHKKAVQRNKIKRRIVSIFDSKIYKSPKLIGLDCVIQVKKQEIKKMKFLDLKEKVLFNLKNLVVKNSRF
jgi:ribonuclease P protein component